MPLISFCGVIISEIQPSPVSPEPEWVEIYNNDIMGFECSDCKIGDSKATTNLPTFRIESGSYIVITKDSLDLATSYILPDSVQIIEASLPALNNGGDEVRLFKDDLLLDSIQYNNKYEKGYSLERIILTQSWERENWSQPEDIKGTPGQKNSTSLKDYDVEIILSYQTDNEVQIVIQNTGTQDLQGLKLEVSDAELFGIGNLSTQGTQDFVFNIDALTPDVYGYQNYSIAVSHQVGSEMRTIKSDSLRLFYPPFGNLKITEIMYEPEDDLCEFFEIYYSGDKPLNLDGFLIGDASNRNDLDTVDIGHVINPDTYLAIGADSTIFNYSNVGNAVVSSEFPSLNNGGDDIIFTFPIRLLEQTDIKAFYTGDEHDSRLQNTKGFSLELLNDGGIEGFRTSTDESGSTPGRVNSWEWINNIDAGIEISPNPFDNSKPTEIRYNLFEGTGYIRANVYNQSLQKVKNLIDGRPGSGKGAIEWDGTDINGKLLPPGVYIIVMEGVRDIDEKTITLRETIVIGS